MGACAFSLLDASPFPTSLQSQLACVDTGASRFLMLILLESLLASLVASAATDTESLRQLMSVEEHLAGHHAGDTGPGGSAVGAPCAIAGMFGCAPFASSDEYNRDGGHPDDGHAFLVSHPFY
eukprot:CAMPEP_0184297792 /NCGR_PEP_ID=MMETSP1049-20130417/8670_1 /TAXON_ID=77928 /ORGANISM="Proteomonas sulcata, Strain CCMP704" /LENGTH=122 /DNA_ID=CAMNT_0026607683 /DNA_START=115 /DNA_END=484 /DNA_ORIENTATION=+